MKRRRAYRRSRLIAIQLREEEKWKVLESVNSDLDDFYTYRRLAKEKPLAASIFYGYTWNVKYILEFAEENELPLFLELNVDVAFQFLKGEPRFGKLHGCCLSSIRHGNEKEILFASCALGLLALTTGGTASEQDTLFTEISEALTRNSGWETKAKILDCLAMITFVGRGYDQEETKRVLKIIWQFIHPNYGSNGVASLALTARAISAWSFLVTSVAGWTLIDSENWHKITSRFSRLLEAEDRFRMAAGDALALLFEIEDSKLFEIEDSESSDAIETLKEKIILQLESLSIEASGRGVSKKNLSEQHAHFKKINKFVRKCYRPNKPMRAGPNLLMASTWCGRKQWDFLYDFLGEHYTSWHFVKKNGLLEDLTEFVKKKVVDKKKKLTHLEKRLYKSPNSYVCKARTQYRKKQRDLFQRNLGHNSLTE